MTAPDQTNVLKLFDLTGKVALITGGTGWLGTAFSTALAQAGARVVISSRERARAQAAADQLPSPAPGSVKHIGVELDHMDSSSIDRFGFGPGCPGLRSSQRFSSASRWASRRSISSEVRRRRRRGGIGM